MNFCPGARHMLCAVLGDVQPSVRGLKNALGRDLLPYLVEQLDKAWSKKHGKPLKEVSVLEFAVPYDECDSDDGLDGLIGVGPC